MSMKRLGLALSVALVLAFTAAAALGQAEPSTAPAAQPAVEQNSAGKTASDQPAKAEDSTPKLDLTPDAGGNLTQEQMQALFRVVADKDLENDKRQRDYTYTERDEEHKVDGKGNVKSTESETFDVMEINGTQVRRKVAKNDQPLSPKDAAKEEERIQKDLAKRRNESDKDRKKREEEEAKDREEGRKWVREIADAYNFRLVGSEEIDGRDNWVIQGEPRPGFHPTLKYAKYLSSFHGRVWVDKTDLQLAKMDVECLNTVSWGLFIARIHKGSRFMMEQTRVNDEVWLPKHEAIKIDVRVALLKNVNFDGDNTYRDYKKFRTTTKILGYGEVKQTEVQQP